MAATIIRSGMYTLFPLPRVIALEFLDRHNRWKPLGPVAATFLVSITSVLVKYPMYLAWSKRPATCQCISETAWDLSGVTLSDPERPTHYTAQTFNTSVIISTTIKHFMLRKETKAEGEEKFRKRNKKKLNIFVSSAWFILQETITPKQTILDSLGFIWDCRYPRKVQSQELHQP
jgi:hypothetical protein